jgi:hypothetical protein
LVILIETGKISPVCQRYISDTVDQLPRFSVVGGDWAMLTGSSALGIGALAIITWNIVFRTKCTGETSE